MPLCLGIFGSRNDHEADIYQHHLRVIGDPGQYDFALSVQLGGIDNHPAESPLAIGSLLILPAAEGKVAAPSFLPGKHHYLVAQPL